MSRQKKSNAKGDKQEEMKGFYILDVESKIAYSVDTCEFTSETTEEGTTITIKGKNEWDKIKSK